MLYFFVTSESFADQPAPLTVQQPPKQTIVLIQAFRQQFIASGHLQRFPSPIPRLSDPVLRTDKSAVLIPEHLGRTNVDFLDDHGSVIGSMEIVVTRQSTTDRVVVYNHPTLGAYSSYHCGANGCEHFEEIPTKEQALAPMPRDSGQPGMPMDNGLPGMPGDNGLPGMPPPQ